MRWEGQRYGKCGKVQDCDAGSSGQLRFTFCLGSRQWVGIVVFCYSPPVLSAFNIPRRGGNQSCFTNCFLPLLHVYVEFSVGKV